MKKALSAVLFVLFIAGVSFAQQSGTASNAVTVKSQENGGFVAVGYINEAIAVRVALSDVLSLEGSFGFWSEKPYREEMEAQGRALYVLKKYNDFNVYAFGGLIVGYYNPAYNDSSIYLGPSLGFGVEYFLVRNLSVSVETGVQGRFYSKSQYEDSFGTFGNWASMLGFRYYLD